MSGKEAFIWVLGISLLIGLLSGLLVKRSGYSFWRYFVTGFIASCGILGIAYNLLRDYF
ncbi:MAG: hypothetical protein MI810_24785 [Flavobacteriales bacterium]|jgi:hypothetical protein|nr:hypothetical protein [Flavobacteriales bacterium]